VKTGTNSFSFFPPLNFFFIAGFLYAGSGNIIVPLVGLAAVGWLTVVVVYLLADMLFGRKAALVAAGMCGLYPNSIFYGMNFYSETLATFWIALTFLMIVKYFTSSRCLYLLPAGIFWGLASQTRGGLHYFAIFICLTILMQYRMRTAKALCGQATLFLSAVLGTIFFIGTIAAPIQECASLNSKSGIGSAIHGANRITTSCSDYGDIRGNIFYEINRCKERWPEKSQLYSDDIMQLGAVQICTKMLAFIAEEPAMYIKNAFLKLSCFWSPNQFLMHYIKTKLYYKNTICVETLCLMISIVSVVIFCGGIGGLFLSSEPLRLVFALFIIFYCALIFFTVGNTKLRAPLEPFLIMYSAHLFFDMVSKKGHGKKVVHSKLVLAVVLAIISNSIYKYGEIILSPGEIEVRQVELCLELGFPATARSLSERTQQSAYYTKDQTVRFEHAKKKLQDALHAHE
ncbi:MAG: glycosyltransferase family 39 protein, partial [Pseudomonadota bacterium]